jgi:hypothetical protein
MPTGWKRMIGRNNMPNGGFDPERKYAQLGERVENQSRQIGDLDSRMGKGFSEIASIA